MHAILPTVEGPFVTPEEVVDALGDEGDDVPLEQIEDVVHRLVAAAFTYTIFRPDLAFKLAGTGSDAKGKGSEDLRSRVQSRNTALELAWTRFWSIVPTELEGKDVALTQWLNFATIVSLQARGLQLILRFTPPTAARLLIRRPCPTESCRHQRTLGTTSNPATCPRGGSYGIPCPASGNER
jgi:hypothetical protein